MADFAGVNASIKNCACSSTLLECNDSDVQKCHTPKGRTRSTVTMSGPRFWRPTYGSPFSNPDVALTPSREETCSRSSESLRMQRSIPVAIGLIRLEVVVMSEARCLKQIVEEVAEQITCVRVENIAVVQYLVSVMTCALSQVAFQGFHCTFRFVLSQPQRLTSAVRNRVTAGLKDFRVRYLCRANGSRTVCSLVWNLPGNRSPDSAEWAAYESETLADE